MPFYDSVKPRPERSRADFEQKNLESFGVLIFFRSWVGKDWTQNLRIFFLDGATSLLPAYPCKSTSPSEVTAKLPEWMDTFQMNPKAICTDMAFHHSHDMQAFHRMHKKRIPTGPRTPWPNRAEIGVRLFKTNLLTLMDTQKLGPDHSGTNHSCPVDAQGSNGEKYTGVTFGGKTPMELAMGRRPTKQDLLNEEIQKNWP